MEVVLEPVELYERKVFNAICGSRSRMKPLSLSLGSSDNSWQNCSMQSMKNLILRFKIYQNMILPLLALISFIYSQG